MAYYSKAPNQKRPPRRPQDEKWEEEGTRYNRGKSPKASNERLSDRYAPKRPGDSRPARGPRPEGRPPVRRDGERPPRPRLHKTHFHLFLSPPTTFGRVVCAGPAARPNFHACAIVRKASAP